VIGLVRVAPAGLAQPTDRRIWAQVAPTPELTTLAETLGRLQFGPDGCALDAERHIWAADEVGARRVRLAPGGDDGRTLLMCAAPDVGEASRSAAREAALLTATVDVPHAWLPQRPPAQGVTVLSESAPSLRPTL
jgi:hypothetical protein